MGWIGPEPAGEEQPWAERLLLALTLSWVFLASLGPTIELDLWFRIRYGQDVIQHHHIPRYENFLWPFPAMNPQFTPGNDWLFSWLMAMTYQLGGLAALPFLKSILVTAFFALEWRALKLAGLPSAWRVPMLFLVYKVYESRLMLRPQLCTDIFLALLVVWHFRSREGPIKHLYVKVFWLFALWSNLHLGVAAGFVFLGLLFAEVDLMQRRFPRQACKLVLCALVGSCLRPDGPYYLLATFQHLSEGADHPYNLEWQPMTLQSLYGAVGLYLVLTIVALARGRKSAHFATALVVTALSWIFAASQVRAVGELAALTPAFLASGLRGANPLAGFSAGRASQRFFVLAAALVLTVSILTELRRPDLLAPMPPHLYPEGAIRYIEKAGRANASSGVFCSYHFGGYLVFRHLQPYVHGMTQFFPSTRFVDYLARLRSANGGQQLLDDGVGWVMLHYAPTNDVHADLARRLARGEAGWGLVYFDDACMLFAPHPAEAFHALMPASTNPVVGPTELAEKELSRLTELLGPDANWVLQIKATLAERRGNDAEALALWNRLLKQDPDRSPALLARGALLFRQDQLAESQADLEGYVRQQPDSVIGHFNLALVLIRRAQKEGQPKNLERAKREVDQAWQLDHTFEPAIKLRSQLRSSS